MSVTLSRLEQTPVSELTTTMRNAGIGGAGGAGFPTYAKWERAESVDSLLVNHQESEPNFFVDKWLGRTHTGALATLFDALLDRLFDVIVVGTKATDRNKYTSELEAATDATVYLPEELPIDDTETGVVFAYTEDRYEYGMESVLLRLVGDTVIGNDLPMDHGWIVQNTESLYNIYRSLTEGTPVTHKHLHVDGDVPRHRFLRAPIGTPATELLEAAGCSVAKLPEDAVLADGGPGWCFLIDEPEQFGIRKRTNCLLLTDEETAKEHTLGEDRINLLGEYDRAEQEMETEPTATIEPDYVRIPMISNPAFEGVVQPSEPIVQTGDRVETGQMVATPSATGISIPHHASIDGTVRAVSERCVEIEANDHGQAGRATAETGTGIGYWTWCMACGSHVLPPLDDPMLDLTRYVCPDCR